MTAIQASVLIVLILAIVGALLVLRNPNKFAFKFKAGKNFFDASGSNDPTPGAVIEGGTSRAGSAIAEDETGRGAAVRNTKTEGDLRAINRDPNRPDPKA